MTNTSINAPQADQNAIRTGLMTAFAAYVLWGAMPAYLKLLSDATALEILSHRILWSVPFGALLLFMRGQWREVKAALSSRRVLGMLAIAALAISTNWLIYVWAVASDRIMEASLGYYINPLMYVAAGVVVLGEKLRGLQIASVIFASVGVFVLTVGGGAFPWVAFALAALFTAYGYIRKTTNVGAMPGLFIEVMLLSPFAFFYLVWLSRAGEMAFLSGNFTLDGLLVLAGPVTVIPLVLFALAARRLTLTTLGFMQYIGPTLQLMLALYFGESFTFHHGICFGLIWLALAIFSYDALRANNKTLA